MPARTKDPKAPRGRRQQPERRPATEGLTITPWIPPIFTMTPAEMRAAYEAMKLPKYRGKGRKAAKTEDGATGVAA